ncbi:MAG TPA: PD-(D/E)XK nuclease family protein, partial [Bacillota bacterium]
ILIHRRLGLGPRLVDPVAGTRSDTVARLAVRHRLHAEALAEEMRVLYVALTRARERLLLVGSVGDLASQLREWVALAHHRPEPLPDAFVLRARSPLDWIVPCLARHRHGQVLRHHGAFRGLPANPELFADASQWHVRLWRADDVIDLVRPERAPEAGTAGGLGEEGQATTRAEPPPTEPAAGAGGGGDGGVDDEFARFERQDWPPAGGRRFAKLSVTEFQRMAAAGAGEGDEEPAAPWLPPADAAPAAPSPRRPRRLRLDDATAGRVADGDAEPHEVGIATHRALQHLPLAQLPDQPGREAICRCLEQMVARELLTPEQARLVAVDDLTALFATTLGRRLQQAARAGRLRRELAFSLRVPASVLGWAAGGGEDWVLVQGMIDALIVETDHLLVVDFKTDRVSGHQVDQRAERYRAQLGWYVEAARRIFARPVAEAYLYFLAARRAVPWNGGEGVATVRR